MNYKQQEEKIKKIQYTLETFRNYKNQIKNLKELSKLTSIPKNSLQRYLKEEVKKYISSEEYEEITEWLLSAKQDGLRRGGINSQINNQYIKDEGGKFNGSQKR